MDLAFQIKKRDLGTLVNSVGSGNYGKIYEVGISLKGFSGPFLYKEYAVEKITGIDFSVLASMIHYVNSIDRFDAEKLISLCSWPLILVVSDDATRPVGFIMQRAPEYFRKSNFPIAGYTDDYKGFQHIFTPDEQYKRATGGDSLLYTERELLLYRLTIILKELHSRQIAIGDISFNNILAAIYPDYKVFLIDSDSMCFRGRSIVSQKHNETVNWYIGKWHPDELPGTYASDCYKLGLVALRLFRKNCIDYDGELPPEVPESLKRLIKASIYSSAGERPTISDWIRLLKEASITRVAQSFFAQGQDMNRQGKKQQAQAAYDKSLVLNPSLAEAYLARAELRISLGDLNGGIDDYNQLGILKSSQKDSYRIKLSQSLYEYGQEESRKGNKAKAIAAYGKAIETNPDSADPLLARAELRMEQRDLNGAIDDYNTLIRLKPDQRDVYNNRLADALLARAELRTQQRDLIGAIDDFNALIRLRPGQKDLYNNRGFCKWEHKDHKGAYDDFNLEIRNNPSAEAFFNRAEAKRHFGDNKGAIADINQGLALNPQKLTPSLKEFYEKNKFLGSTSVSRWIASIADQMRENWKLNNQRRSNGKMAGGIAVAQLLPFKRSAIYLGILLFLPVSCAALIQYDRHLALTKEQSLVTQLKKLRDSGDYESCVRKEADIRSQLRDALRFESAQIKVECLSGQHNNLFNKTNSMSGSSRNVESFRQLHEELRAIANEAYTNAQLLGKIQQTQELLKSRIKEYADELYQQSDRINDVVQLYQLAGDYDKARSLRNAWREDESRLNDALDRLKRLRSPREHNPFEQSGSEPVFWFKWPKFNTVYWKNQFEQQYPPILTERVVRAAKNFMTSRDWVACVQAAEQASMMAKRIGDSNLESESEDYRQKCTVAKRLEDTP